MNKDRFSPRQFMERRRPEYYSDSVVEKSNSLDRPTFEYYLSNLAHHSAELKFEDFARKLLQKTVCPNLLPHTGPTAGGDSKVDTETYPVAEGLALSWVVGFGNLAATEKWAFAISIQQDWVPKIKSDIEKLVATNRGYSQAFFVSSQFISDKKRGEVEDLLTQKFGLPVHIFDRNWILDKTFESNSEQIACDEFGLQKDVSRQVKTGPMDAGRESEFSQIKIRIEKAIQDSRFDAVLVDDCIEMALIARALGHSCADVDGLFLRAERLAAKFGIRHQQITCIHERGWTALFWNEDYSTFLDTIFSTSRSDRTFSPLGIVAIDI